MVKAHVRSKTSYRLYNYSPGTASEPTTWDQQHQSREEWREVHYYRGGLYDTFSSS